MRLRLEKLTLNQSDNTATMIIEAINQTSSEERKTQTLIVSTKNNEADACPIPCCCLFSDSSQDMSFSCITTDGKIMFCGSTLKQNDDRIISIEGEGWFKLSAKRENPDPAGQKQTGDYMSIR